VTTHYIEEVEQADRVAIIDQGKLLAIDTPLALKSAYGHEVLEVSPINAEVRAHIVAEYQHKIVKTSEDQLTLKVEDGRFIEHFLSIYGSQVRAMTRIEPSLESVFLSLTGRAIRDQEASARERTLAFGKQGGEHTR
jgi:ABC-2 type transport system ATP-binding protein